MEEHFGLEDEEDQDLRLHGRGAGQFAFNQPAARTEVDKGLQWSPARRTVAGWRPAPTGDSDRARAGRDAPTGGTPADLS